MSCHQNTKLSRKSAEAVARQLEHPASIRNRCCASSGTFILIVHKCTYLRLIQHVQQASIKKIL